MTTLHASLDPFVGTLTTTNMHGLVHLSSMTSNFLDNAGSKIQNMAFKTSKMDQITLKTDIMAFSGV